MSRMPTTEVLLLKRILRKLERIESEIKELNRKLSPK